MGTTIKSFWQELKNAGLVSGSPPPPSAYSPWYIRLMLGASGWLAAVFLLLFVAIGLEFIVKNDPVSISAGVLSTAIAYFMFRGAVNDFVEQFALALSLSGQALILFGTLNILSWDGSTPWLAAAALQAAVAVMMPNAVQRMIAAYLTSFALSVAFTIMGSPFIISAIVSIAAAVLWLNEYQWSRYGSTLRPLGYGLTVSLIQLKGQLFFEETLYIFAGSQNENQVFFSQWFGELITGFLLVAVVYRLLTRHPQKWTVRHLFAMLVTAAVASVSLEAPGIATGLMIILLGFANSNRILLGLGIAAMLFYVSAYYYSLQATLLTKAELLAATGIVLLLVRLIASKWLADPTEAGNE